MNDGGLGARGNIKNGETGQIEYDDHFQPHGTLEFAEDNRATLTLASLTNLI